MQNCLSSERRQGQPAAVALLDRIIAKPFKDLRPATTCWNRDGRIVVARSQVLVHGIQRRLPVILELRSWLRIEYNEGRPQKISIFLEPAKMSQIEVPPDILALSVADRIELVAKIWDSIEDTQIEASAKSLSPKFVIKPLAENDIAEVLGVEYGGRNPENWIRRSR